MVEIAGHVGIENNFERRSSGFTEIKIKNKNKNASEEHLIISKKNAKCCKKR